MLKLFWRRGSGAQAAPRNPTHVKSKVEKTNLPDRDMRGLRTAHRDVFDGMVDVINAS
jgi:hypothetical protein